VPEWAQRLRHPGAFDRERYRSNKRRREAAAKPIKPAPNTSKVLGSGTLGGGTVPQFVEDPFSVPVPSPTNPVQDVPVNSTCPAASKLLLLRVNSELAEPV
jgi:hypothetical protein